MDAQHPLTEDEIEIRDRCLGSLLYFIEFFYQARNGREFRISQPKSNESHFITVCREFVKCFEGDTQRLIINLPPGWGKSEMCKHFIAWAMAHYPDSNFLYVSLQVELAAKHTHGVKQIMEMPLYKRLFDVHIRQDSSAKDHFTTTKGGVVSGWGAKGGIVGYDAGLPGEDRFTGALVIDDIHKPDEVHSDTIREHVKMNYKETLERRLRSPRVPVIFIGQRLHEDDLPGNLIGNKENNFTGFDGQHWERVIIKALDDCGNAVYPEMNPKSMLENLRETSPYVFASQYQQDPQPAGGGIFKEIWFPKLDLMPEIESTFITVDTAETNKTYNDATVFSFWGLYKMEKAIGDVYALHWLDCREMWVEPKDLEPEFLDFFAKCSRFDVKPQLVAIEKKSTGSTLLSLLSEFRGCRIMQIPRISSGGNSKTSRFLGAQPLVAAKRVSLPSEGEHTTMCIEHMRKITANDTHARDDIADTCVDAIQLGLVDRMVTATASSNGLHDQFVAKKVMGNFNRSLKIRKRMAFRTRTHF